MGEVSPRVDVRGTVDGSCDAAPPAGDRRGRALRARLFPDPSQIPNEAPWKYLDVRRALRVNLRRAQRLGLLRECVPPGSRRILDLGCGAGFFLFICRIHGYEGVGLDVGDVPLYDEILPILGVERIDARIETFGRLPEFPHAFDVITAFGTVFNRDDRGWWREEEWAHFLDDARRHLAPGRRISIEPNPMGGAVLGERGTTLFSPEVRRIFLQRGAVLDRHAALFPPVPVQSAPAVATTRSRRSRPRRSLRRVALAAAAALVVALVGGEIGVRAFDPQEMRLRWYSREGVMVLVPGYRGEVRDSGASGESGARAEYARLEINSDGLHDREYSDRLSSDTFRILVLGDSLTAGLEVPAQATYPKKLESLLAGWHRTERVEVVNAGIPGYGTADELRYLESFGGRWKPDLVVVAFYEGNDIDNNLSESGVRYADDGVRVARKRLSEWQYRVRAVRSWIGAHSHLYHFLHARTGRTAQPSASRGEPTAHGWKLTIDLLDRIDVVSRELGARVVLMSIPSPGRETGPAVNPLRQTHVLRAFAAREGVSWIDLAPTLEAAASSPDRRLWQQERCFTAAGHEMAARALAAFLTKEGLVSHAGARRGANRIPGVS